jgi:hypothetical protein
MECIVGCVTSVATEVAAWQTVNVSHNPALLLLPCAAPLNPAAAAAAAAARCVLTLCWSWPQVVTCGAGFNGAAQARHKQQGMLSGVGDAMSE